MARKPLTLFMLAVLAGCGGERANTAAADSLSRDLQRLPSDSTAELADRPAMRQPAASRPAPKAAPKARVTAKAKPRPAPSPAVRSLAAGTVVAASFDREINSRHDRAGDSVTATVATDVQDAGGRVVIPAGSRVRVLIAEIHESERKSDKSGKLSLQPVSVEIAGRSFALSGSAGAPGRILRDRPTNAGDVAKVGMGAGAGAVVGRVIGGSTKGAVIGGVLGGAVGAQRAVETQDRDVVVPLGSRLTVTLDAGFRREV